VRPLLLALALALTACHPGVQRCGAPPPGLDETVAEIDVVGRYAATLAACDGELSLERLPPPPFVIDTEPPIQEITWRVEGCANSLRLTLDCSTRSEGTRCGANELPPIVRAPERFPMQMELAFAIGAAREIPCPRPADATEPGMRLHRTRVPGEALTARWQVERCATTRELVVFCNPDGKCGTRD
jgi:hypothetical protein